jgi:hypothetical protein
MQQGRVSLDRANRALLPRANALHDPIELAIQVRRDCLFGFPGLHSGPLLTNKMVNTDQP